MESSHNANHDGKSTRVLLAYGFSPLEAAKIIVDFNHDNFLPAKTLKSSLQALEEFGFTPEQVRRIVNRYPRTVTMSGECINGHLAGLRQRRRFHNRHSLTLSQNEVKKLLLAFPPIIGFGPHASGWRLRTMAIVTEGDKKEMVEKADLWLQSPKKSVHRARFLDGKGIEWRHNKRIFESERNFATAYPDYRPELRIRKPRLAI